MKTLILIPFLFAFNVRAQQPAVQSFDLKNLYENHKLISGRVLKPFVEGDRHGVSCKGIVWLKDMTFSTGVIEIDLRGKDVFQESFLGIAFHGVDTITYDAVYFRPFNFLAKDPERRVHAVQYVSSPDNHWDKLRKDFPGVYEKGITPAPAPDKWFHARIEIGKTDVKVFVNQATAPSLVVNRLNNRLNGLVGIWSTNQGVDGDFSNLSIKETK